MPATYTPTIFDSVYLTEALRVVIYIFLFLYAIFALLIVRQVSIMVETLVTPVSPIVKATAIIHAGFAVGLAIFVAGTL